MRAPLDVRAGKTLAKIWQLPDLILGALMMLAVALNLVAVIARYVFLAPLVYTEEVLGFMLVWMVYIGAILATRDDAHIRMDLVSSLLPSKGRRVLLQLEYVLTIIICSLIAFLSLRLLFSIARSGERAIVTDVPMFLLFAALPTGFAFMVATTLAALRRQLRGELGQPRGKFSE